MESGKNFIYEVVEVNIMRRVALACGIAQLLKG